MSLDDGAVSGADPIETRAGFDGPSGSDRGRACVPSSSSRMPVASLVKLMAQELGMTSSISRRVRLLTASGDDLTGSDDRCW